MEPARGDIEPAVAPAIAATTGQPPSEVTEPALGRFIEPMVGVIEPPVESLLRVMENMPGVMVPEAGPLPGTCSEPPLVPGTGTDMEPSRGDSNSEVGPLIGAAGNHSTEPATARLWEPGLGLLQGSETCKARRAARLREPAAGVLFGIPASGAAPGRLVMEPALGVMVPAIGLRCGTVGKPPTASDAGNAPLAVVVGRLLPLAPKVVDAEVEAALVTAVVIACPLAPLLGPVGQVIEAPRWPDMVTDRTPNVLMTSSGDLPVASAAATAQSGVLVSSPASRCITS